MKVTLPKIVKVPRTTKYRHAGFVSVGCEIVADARCGQSDGAIIRLTESGAGYPAGHTMLVGKTSLT